MKFITWLKSLFTHPVEENISMSKIALSLGIPAGVVADGATVNTLTVTVTDDTGAALSAQNLTLAADAGVTLSDTVLTTDANGQATASLTSSTAGTHQVTATLADGTAQSISVPFLAVPVAPVADSAQKSTDSTDASQVVSEIDPFVARLKKLVSAAGTSAHHVFDELVELALKIEHPGSLLK